MANHSSILAWRIPCTGLPCGSLVGCSPWDLRVRHDLSNLSTHLSTHTLAKFTEHSRLFMLPSVCKLIPMAAPSTYGSQFLLCESLCPRLEAVLGVQNGRLECPL